MKGVPKSHYTHEGRVLELENGDFLASCICAKRFEPRAFRFESLEDLNEHNRDRSLEQEKRREYVRDSLKRAK